MTAGAMQAFHKRWICLDDGMEIINEADYRFHTSIHPDHKVVSEE
jgi:hypothetical protein